MCKVNEVITEEKEKELYASADEHSALESSEVDEDARLDYQSQREEEVADSADRYFAPSQGY
jgi:hypothetical protein